jgi:hypothetical protein
VRCVACQASERTSVPIRIPWWPSRPCAWRARMASVASLPAPSIFIC